MDGIGIVGAGVAGLHLGLLLRQHGVPVTLYSARTPEQLGSGRLPNVVAHHDTTLRRERALGIEHWSAGEYGYGMHHYYFGGTPLRFPGFFTAPSRAVDYRLYLPRLVEDFIAAGGHFDVRTVAPTEVEALSERHDLLTIATGRDGLAGMFPRRAEKSPFIAPQRRLCAGLYTGISPAQPKGVTLSVAPGHGELIEIPMFSFAGHVSALLFEAVPGGAFEALADADHAEDPARFTTLVLDTLNEHHPTIAERVVPGEFGLTGPQDLLQGQITPVVNEDFVRLPNGRPVIAFGDVHAVVDPVNGQGANCASYSAWELGQAILADAVYDERFCRKAADRRRDRVESTTDWTNLMLDPPPEHLLTLVGAMAQNQDASDEFTNNFNFPERQWDILATPQRTRAFLARHGM